MQSTDFLLYFPYKGLQHVVGGIAQVAIARVDPRDRLGIHVDARHPKAYDYVNRGVRAEVFDSVQIPRFCCANLP
jgi:hypothetical protein